jgi:hypothetical protein
MGDRITSWLRTVTPGLWSSAVGTLLVWAATHAPWLVHALDALGIDLTSPGVVAGVVALVLAGWHALWRRLEPHLPPWLTRALLGSNRVPVYVEPGTPAAAPMTGAAQPRAPASPAV